MSRQEQRREDRAAAKLQLQEEREQAQQQKPLTPRQQLDRMLGYLAEVHDEIVLMAQQGSPHEDGIYALAEEQPKILDAAGQAARGQAVRIAGMKLPWEVAEAIVNAYRSLRDGRKVVDPRR